MEAFQQANEITSSRPVYENVVISETGRAVRSSSGVTIGVHRSLAGCPPLHTLVVPGGAGARISGFPQTVVRWIAEAAPRLRRLGSICTGLFILAQTGLLDGRRVTTHWSHGREAQDRFPKLRVVEDTLFLRQGKLFTAAGVTAGIDMALALIEEDLGPTIAVETARHLVVFVKRPGDQRQYSSALRHQAAAPDEFADLAAWIAEHVADDLSSETLADRTGLSERQFRRRFAKAFGETPTRHVERIRIEVASGWLIHNSDSVESIACGVGFSNADTFRRAFERLRGVSPSEYRQRFGGAVS